MIPGIIAGGIFGGEAPSGSTYVGGKIEVVTDLTSQTISLTDLTGGTDSAPEEGDLVVIGYMATGTYRLVLVSPFHYRRLGYVYSVSTSAVSVAMWAAFMDATPDTSFDVSGVGASTRGGVVVVEVWRGIDPAYMTDGAVQLAAGTSTTRADPPSITPATPGALVVAVGAGAQTSNSAESPYTSSDLDNFKSLASADVDMDGVIGMGSVQWAGGTVDPAQFGGSSTGTNRAWGAITAAFRPGSTPLPSGPISFVGSLAYNFSGSGGTIDLTTDLLDTSGSPATLQEGDILIGGFGGGGGTSFQGRLMRLIPSLFSPFHDAASSDDTLDSALAAGYKFMGASPDTSILIPAGDYTRAIGTIFALRGVHRTRPIDVAPVTASGIDTGRPDPAAITPTTTGAWILCFGCAGVSGGGDLTIPTGLSATTNHWRAITQTSGTLRAAAAGGLKDDWTSGAFDCPQFGGGSTNSQASWTAVTVAIRPGP
jgi:hypothetical protein